MSHIDRFAIELGPHSGILPDGVGPLFFTIRYRVDGEWRTSVTPLYGEPQHFESELEFIARSALAEMRRAEEERRTA